MVEKAYKKSLFSLEDEKKVYEILSNSNIILEIGSGNGVFLEHLGKMFKDNIVVGIELDIKRARKCKKKIERNSLRNTFILSGDAYEILALFFEDGSVERVYLNFPEPWPRESDWRNRLFEIGFLSMIDRVTKKNGLFYMVTDVEKAFLTACEILEKVLGSWRYREDLVDKYKSFFVPTFYYEKWLLENRKFLWGVWEKKY